MSWLYPRIHWNRNSSHGSWECICLKIATCHLVMYQTSEQNRGRTLVLGNTICVQSVEYVLLKIDKPITTVDARLLMILKFLLSLFCFFLEGGGVLHCEACGILVSWWSEMLVHHSCLTLCDPTDYSLPGFSVHGILQARIPEWIVIPFSRGSSQPRDRTQVSCIAGRFFTVWATGKTNQGSNPTPLHWKHRVLNTRLSGKSWHWSSLTEDIL